MNRVLWIEDGAQADLADLTGPVYLSGLYDLVVAMDASEAVQAMLAEEFTAVIVDVRILPGHLPEWIALYNQFGRNKTTARLGLHLLQALLSPAQALVKIPRIPAWIAPSRFGVLTIEGPADVERDLTALGLTNYRRKRVEGEDRKEDLLDIISAVIGSTSSGA